MKTSTVLIILCVIGMIYCLVKGAKYNMKNETVLELTEKFTTGNAFGSIAENVSVTGVLQADRLYIYQNFHANVSVSLPYHKITNVKIVTDVEIHEKSKSVVGRAILGGIVLGPVGAIVGGISGTGTKKQKEVNKYMLVSYKPTPGGEEQGILLKVGLGSWRIFMSALEQRANITSNKSVDL